MKYKIFDRQTMEYSNHDTIEGLCEMLVDEWNYYSAEDESEMIDLSKWNVLQMLDFIESYDYEVIEEGSDE